MQLLNSQNELINKMDSLKQDVETSVRNCDQYGRDEVHRIGT